MTTVTMTDDLHPPRPGKLRVWWQALRAYSFPASIVPCLVGAGHAAASGAPVDWAYLPLLLGAGVALHVGTNLVNDAEDFARGVDDVGAQGGSGVLVAGWLTARQMWLGAAVSLACAVAFGLPLLLDRGWPLLAIGLTGAAGGYAYTGPPFGLKYRALGEVVVFLLMGVLMVAGAGYALAGAFLDGVLVASIPVGFLVAAILAANNQRDRADDARLGIHTLAIILGPAGARAVVLALVAGAYASIAVLVLAGWAPWTGALALLTLPLAIPAVRGVLAAMPGRGPVPGLVERVAALELVCGGAWAAGLALGALVS